MKTPYEIVYGHKPTIAHFRAFGCPCTLLKNLESTPKFGAKADDCCFDGYAGRTAYRVYNKSTKQIVESYDVRWLEEMRPMLVLVPTVIDTEISGADVLHSEKEDLPVVSHISPILDETP
ncbi:uncharacterized protein LOC143534513 [Bidens hawaiensis]|uniref:uncharacterized protein LOC143534513 n=1 Tax=Bidens hawaiensis TaxID=980011 RepID=UPI00404B6704